jgi:hypothetical protein
LRAAVDLQFSARQPAARKSAAQGGTRPLLRTGRR